VRLCSIAEADLEARFAELAGEPPGSVEAIRPLEVGQSGVVAVRARRRMEQTAVGIEAATALRGLCWILRTRNCVRR
jgi:hypothetical protein